MVVLQCLLWTMLCMMGVRFPQVVVRYTDAILGGCLTVQTIHGEVQLYVPPGTQDGDRLTVPGAGISPGAALLAGLSEQRQLGAGYSHRGAHHYAVTLLIPAQARLNSPCLRSSSTSWMQDILRYNAFNHLSFSPGLRGVCAQYY